MDDNSLLVVYPQLASLAFNINSLVSEHEYYRIEEWNWKLLIHRPVGENHCDKFKLIQSLSHIDLDGSGNDQPRWRLHPTGKFTVDSCYKFLNYRGISWSNFYLLFHLKSKHLCGFWLKTSCMLKITWWIKVGLGILCVYCACMRRRLEITYLTHVSMLKICGICYIKFFTPSQLPSSFDSFLIDHQIIFKEILELFGIF